MKILSAEQIRSWDQFTIEREGISSFQLMERAAGTVTDWIIKQSFDASNYTIFCGEGNNGGDGLAIARQLTNNNLKVEVYILQSEGKASADFEANLMQLQSMQIDIHWITSQELFPLIQKGAIIIDALFGSGLNRPIEGLAAALINHINNSAANVISVDLPSGLFIDKTSKGNAIIKATSTLTFQTLKLAFLMPENEEYLGEVTVLDIGLQKDYLQTIDAGYELVDHEVIGHIYKPRKQFSHKGTYGHALIVAGENGKMGAAVLCTRSCLRAGAGLVTSCVPPEEFAIIQISAPEAMAISHKDAATLEWSKYSSVGFGPGIGTNESSKRLLQDVLDRFKRPMVIDADGLNILSKNNELLKTIPAESVLSPHPKEFERLFGKTGNGLERLELAKQKAQELHVNIILKGHYTAVICADGSIFFNSTGNAGMATGGSGDVLTGILAGLIAQNYSPREACLLGVFIHGLAGDIAAEKLSQEAMLSGDIIDFLGEAFKSSGK